MMHADRGEVVGETCACPQAAGTTQVNTCSLCGVLALAGLVLAVALYYDVNPVYVARTFIRALTLQLIGVVVGFFHVGSAPLRAALGPSGTGKHLDGSVERLLELIRSEFKEHSVVVERFENEQFITSTYEFSYQSRLAPELSLLRETYDLDVLSLGGEDDFRSIIAIANWVHGRWEHGISGAKYFNAVSFNVNEVLSRASQGYQFWCHVYSMALIQICAALGYQARLVALSTDGYESNDMHAVAEVWTNYYRKWVAVDANFNVWYSLNECPLSVLEIHNVVMAGETDAVSIEKGIARPAQALEGRIFSLYRYYKYFAIDMRNDWLSNPYFPGHPMRSDNATLFWVDRRNRPVLNLYRKAKRESDIYWDLNRTYAGFLGTEGEGGKGVGIFMSTRTPDFDHFEVRFDGEEPIKMKEASLFWPLHLYRNSMSVRAVNSAGVKGVESHVAVHIENREK